MALDAEVQQFLASAAGPVVADQPPAERRAAILAASDDLFRAFGQPGGEVHSLLEVGPPAAPVRVRIYRPTAATGLPVHLFFHGGGWWLGSVDELVVDATCRDRALGAESIVVSVDYGRAPEHRFPEPVEHCYAAVLWAVEHAASFGGDAGVVSVGGLSAGANLAAAVALATRDRGGPDLVLQLLEVPALDLTLDTMRASGVGDGYGLTVADMQLATDLYLAQPDDARNPLASPLLADDLTGLPPARIMTAEFDPLRLDGQRYAERLRAAGVAVEVSTQQGAIHGSSSLTGTWAPARQWRDDVVAALRAAHGRQPATASAAHGRG